MFLMFLMFMSLLCSSTQKTNNQVNFNFSFDYLSIYLYSFPSFFFSSIGSIDGVAVGWIFEYMNLYICICRWVDVVRRVGGLGWVG